MNVGGRAVEDLGVVGAFRKHPAGTLDVVVTVDPGSASKPPVVNFITILRLQLKAMALVPKFVARYS